MGTGKILIDSVVETDPVTGQEVTYTRDYTPDFALIWRNPLFPPEIFGVAPGATLQGSRHSQGGLMHRDGTVLLKKRRPEDIFVNNNDTLERWPNTANGGGVQTSPVFSSPSPTYPAMGGSFAFRSYLSTELGLIVHPWIWPAVGTPQSLYTVTRSAPGATALNFQSSPTTIGTAPGGEACVNLSGQVLVGHSGRYYQVPALQGATKISPHGAALLPGTSGNPEIWFGGSTYSLSSCVSNPQSLGTSLTVRDVNDDGSMLAIVNVNTASQKLLILLPVDLAIDANRDGTIASGEAASQDKPFRFWINNDDDPNTLGDDVEEAMKEDELSPPGSEDWLSASTLGHIDGVRDIEDFTRLHLALPADIVQMAKTGEVQVGFKWTNGSGPRVRVYKAQGDEGDEKHLFYKYEANLQMGSDHRSAVADVKGSQTAFLPSSYWQGIAAGTSKLNFIFEGCEKGTAKLTTVIKFGSSAEAEGAGVWIKLMDVQEMFERGKVATPMSEADNVPDPWLTTEPLTFQSTSDPNGNAFEADPDETKQYIIYVHGWRLSYHEAQTWANTSFKRLWHLGYKGRFTFFSWPTFSGADSAIDGYLTYNKSEYRAWLSGAALKSYVASLPSGYTKNIMAHSMGNVVVGSAFRQGMGGVSNYSLLNAAMAAQAYDATRIDIPSRQTPDTDSDPAVRTNFGLSSKFSGITAKTTNFYLEDDFATTIWSLNHATNKPQIILNELGGVLPLDRAYGYSNEGWNVGGALHKLVQLEPIVETVPLRGVTMPEEAMAFVTQTRSLPAGRTPTNLGMPNGSQIDMARMDFGDTHSAQWIWSLQRTFSVWRELLYSFDINPNPLP
jgi:hypothetical protein